MRRGWFGSSVALFESDIEVVHPTGKPKPRLSFHVTRPKEFNGQTLGGNRAGYCTVAEVQRSGTLVIHADGGKRMFFPAGTWVECSTEPSTKLQQNGRIGER